MFTTSQVTTSISEHRKSTDPSLSSNTNTTIIPRFDLENYGGQFTSGDEKCNLLKL